MGKLKGVKFGTGNIVRNVSIIPKSALVLWLGKLATREG